MRAARDGVSDPLLLRAGHEVVDEDPVAPHPRRRFIPEQVVEEVDALEELHGHALGAQVRSPHLLHELRVVLPLDEDPARQRDARPLVRRGERARCRPAPPLRRRGWPDELHGLPVDHVPGAEREDAPPACEVLQLDVRAVDAGDGAAEAVDGDLDHQIELGRHTLRPSSFLARAIPRRARP